MKPEQLVEQLKRALPASLRSVVLYGSAAAGDHVAGKSDFNILVVAERYPDLKASKNFSDLQFELAGTENRISVERQRYNDAVRAYNTAVRQFPDSLIAGLRGFRPSTAYFEAAPAAKEAPKVQF